MSLTTDETIRLGKLKAAYDKLLLGQMVAEVESDGERLRYVQPTEANIRRLKAEIDALEAKASGGCARLRGALKFRV